MKFPGAGRGLAQSTHVFLAVPAMPKAGQESPGAMPTLAQPTRRMLAQCFQDPPRAGDHPFHPTVGEGRRDEGRDLLIFRISVADDHPEWISGEVRGGGEAAAKILEQLPLRDDRRHTTLRETGWGPMGGRR